jgi:hypothetical protein
MELFESMGIGRDAVDKYAPVVVGAAGALIALVVARFVGVRGWRGAKAAYAWWKTPAAPPEPGSDAWFASKLVELMAPDNDETWVRTGTGQYHRIAGDKSKIAVAVSRSFVSATAYAATGGAVDYGFEDRRTRRAGRALKNRLEERESARSRAKYFETAAPVFQAFDADHSAKAVSEVASAVNTDKPDHPSRWVWRLRTTDRGGVVSPGAVCTKPGVTSVAEVAEWAYETMSGFHETYHVVELTRTLVGGTAQESVMTWVWEPAAGNYCLLTTAVKSVGNLTGDKVVWSVGESNGSSPYAALGAAQRAPRTVGGMRVCDVTHTDTVLGVRRLVGRVTV